MSMLWLPTALVVPLLLAMLVTAHGQEASEPRLIAGAVAAGTALCALLAPFAVVAPFADRLDSGSVTLTGAWLESGFLEEFAKAAALWLLLVPHGLGATPAKRAQGAVLVSLGFGAYENLLYLADAVDPASLVLMRSLISLPAHLTAGMASAIVLLVRPKANVPTALMAFVVAWFTHGTFNQWALGWAEALAGRAVPEDAPFPAVLALAAAPFASAWLVGEVWQRLSPVVRGERRRFLPWALVTVLIALASVLILARIVQDWSHRPAMLTMAMPFTLLPLLLARLTGSLALDVWRSRRLSAQVRR
jgi:hypothetical protein